MLCQWCAEAAAALAAAAAQIGPFAQQLWGSDGGGFLPAGCAACTARPVQHSCGLEAQQGHALGCQCRDIRVSVCRPNCGLDISQHCLWAGCRVGCC